MTISAQGVRAVYQGSGSTGPFTLEDEDASPILFAANGDIVATRFDEDGVPDVLTILIDYTLTGAGSSTAGSLTLLSALAVGEELVIQRVTPKTQLIDLIAGGKLSMTALEGALDKLTRMSQDNADGVLRAIKMPITYEGDDVSFPDVEEGFYIGWSDDGELENKTPPTSFLSGTAVPDSEIGSNGDFYLRTTTSDLYKKIASAWVLQMSLTGPAGPTGATGATGATGTSVRSGSGAPDNGLGNDGDFYLNTANYNLHGPKASGVWPAGVSLVGPAGAGSGDVVGPSGGVADNEIALYSGTTGKLIKGSSLTAANILTESEAAAAYQPLDADLTAIAALTTTSFGRSLLAGADAAAVRTLLGTGTGDSPQFTAVNIGAASDTTLARSAAGLITVEGVAVLLAGRQTIPVMAGSMSPRATAPASAGTFGVGLPTLDFDTTTQEYAVFSIPMPKSWNESTVTFQPIWTNAAGLTTETVVFSLSGAALSNDDAGAAPSQGTVQTSTDTWLAQNDIHFGPESAAITIGGSPAEGDLVVFEISRVTGSDNLTGDAKLLGINLFITTNAATDA